MSSDFIPGDPASYVCGRPDERPARVHAPQKPKPPLSFQKKLLLDIRERKNEIKFATEEVPRLMEALKRLEEVNEKFRAGKRR